MFSLKKKSDRALSKKWTVLETSEELSSGIKMSFEKPVAIFKHSTRCGISSMALQRMIIGDAEISEDLQLYYLDLIAHRALSNEVAAKLSVRHESPQIILIDKGEAVYHRSHQDINVEDLMAEFNRLASK